MKQHIETAREFASHLYDINHYCLLTAEEKDSKSLAERLNFESSQKLAALIIQEEKNISIKREYVFESATSDEIPDLVAKLLISRFNHHKDCCSSINILNEISLQLRTGTVAQLFNEINNIFNNIDSEYFSYASQGA